jgi:hypothetical protein
MRKPYRRQYSQAHRAKRKALAPGVEAGLYNCARCQQPILPGQEWDLGHIDGDRFRYAGPEHRHSRDCPEGGNRATSRHRKLREMYLEEGGRRRSREW